MGLGDMNHLEIATNNGYIILLFERSQIHDSLPEKSLVEDIVESSIISHTIR